MASKALKKQFCYALGTLGGWGLAKLTNAKETVPFTILGGLAGFAISENVYGSDDSKLIKPYVADKKKDDELSGTQKRGKRKMPAVELVHSPAFTSAELRKLTAKRRKRKRTKKQQ